MVEAAKKDRVSANMGLVHACCKRFVGKGIEYDDMFQAGCMGLVKAARGFDESRGLAFSTYAVPVILGEIRHLFREGGSVKVSRSLRELAMRASVCRERLCRTNGREPTVNELAEALQVEPSELAGALTAVQPTCSLTASAEDGEREIDVPIAPPEDELVESLSLSAAIDELDLPDRTLIRLRYFGGKTQSQTAGILGMTQVQVSRREKVILQRLRGILNTE